MAIFFTADLHFDHANIIDYCKRPFATIEEMNLALVKNWNDVVQKNDLVIVAGDLSLKLSSAQKWLPLLNGVIVLVPGNHDACHPIQKKASARAKYMEAGAFAVVDLTHEILIVESQPKVLVSHMPYAGHRNERYHAWHPKDEGRWLVHGHVHCGWKVKGRQINVGVDVWDYRPVHASEILAIMEQEVQQTVPSCTEMTFHDG